MPIEIEPSMCLIDDDEVGRRQFPPHQGLYGGDLYQTIAVGHRVIGLDHANISDALGKKLR